MISAYKFSINNIDAVGWQKNRQPKRNSLRVVQSFFTLIFGDWEPPTHKIDTQTKNLSSFCRELDLSGGRG